MNSTPDTVSSTTNGTQVSTGAAIVISVIWIMMTSLTAGLIYFVWLQPIEGEMSADAGFFLLIATVAPLIAAYSITMKILDKDD